MNDKPRQPSMKNSAVMATILATVTVSSCLVVFPLLFTHLQSLESQAQSEIDFCEVTFNP